MNFNCFFVTVNTICTLWLAYVELLASVMSVVISEIIEQTHRPIHCMSVVTVF